MDERQVKFAELVNWAKETQIYPPMFDCHYYNECNSSIGGYLDRGNGCLMSYVGRTYNDVAQDDAFRLVIVGMDHGDSGGGTFEFRTTGIQDWYQRDQHKFNPQYRGLVKTASAVLGQAGSFCARECVNDCQKTSTSSETHECVLDRIVQPNSVKCTPSNQADRRSRATDVMQRNCANHLVSELQILRPNLVVFHGASARYYTIPAFKALNLDILPVEESKSDSHGFVLFFSNTLNAHILFLYHPTYGWLDSQWDSVVTPSLNYLREKRLIPR